MKLEMTVNELEREAHPALELLTYKVRARKRSQISSESPSYHLRNAPFLPRKRHLDGCFSVHVVVLRRDLLCAASSVALASGAEACPQCVFIRCSVCSRRTAAAPPPHRCITQVSTAHLEGVKKLKGALTRLQGRVQKARGATRYHHTPTSPHDNKHRGLTD